MLGNLDKFLCESGLTSKELPKNLADMWLKRRTRESTHSLKKRIAVVRQFATYLVERGVRAYVPDSRLCRVERHKFKPRFLTLKEIRALLKASDHLNPSVLAPLRHLLVPELFRVLYGCGLRLSEALNLKVKDVDLRNGVLTIWQAKFGKDRYVPMADTLVKRLRRYSRNIALDNPEANFFPNRQGAVYSLEAIYKIFRQLLWRAGIPHEGRGKGPRIHDIRHAMAVHRLLKWYRQGADLAGKLPVLAVYLGHQNLAGTQTYLHMTTEFFPDLADRFQAAYGHLIPQVWEEPTR